MIYEQRIYRCLPGRMPALLKRFENVTLPVWKRLGIRQAGFWTYIIGPCSVELVYMLAWESMAERETKWAVFNADPEWIAGRIKSEEDGPIVAHVASAFMQPTSFSSVR
jgi:NIPSNAP